MFDACIRVLYSCSQQKLYWMNENTEMLSFDTGRQLLVMLWKKHDTDCDEDKARPCHGIWA